MTPLVRLRSARPLRLALATSALVLAHFHAQAGEPPAPRPNLLFIFSDDQCFNTIRALGNPEVQTPHLDRLAAAGTTLTHAYNMGSWSGAVCVPSRTMLNTGRFLWPIQTLERQLEEERQAGRLWAPALRRAGYTTYFTGKWHVNVDARKVFAVTRHVRAGMPKDTPEGYNRPHPERPDTWKPWDPKFGGFWEGGQHWSEAVADDAADYLAMAADRPEPFFMYLAFNAPHDPRQSPKDYVDKYPLDAIQVPANFLPLYPYKDDIGCGEQLRDERLAPFPRTPHAVQVHRQEYYALITHLDTQIGRILAALERSGKARTTYIFFTSDHGLAVGQHGLFGKQNLYDHSVRVPLIVVGPDIPAGRRIAAPVYLQDIMPTTLELAGLPKPDHVQFHSLLPLLRGQTDRSPYDAIYGAYLGLQRAVTSEGYKLILYPKIPKARLYDLQTDPLERVDLAARPEHRPRMQRLFAQLLALQRQTGDPLELKAAFPDFHLQ
ncbi:MAG: DUF4976 domain-containing protein [Verrucomicrobia bacterium]|nr:DUF4976 domain-containing protein [Verrucomicrobiota bacterium]